MLKIRTSFLLLALRLAISPSPSPPYQCQQQPRQQTIHDHASRQRANMHDWVDIKLVQFKNIFSCFYRATAVR